MMTRGKAWMQPLRPKLLPSNPLHSWAPLDLNTLENRRTPVFGSGEMPNRSRSKETDSSGLMLLPLILPVSGLASKVTCPCQGQVNCLSQYLVPRKWRRGLGETLETPKAP